MAQKRSNSSRNNSKKKNTQKNNTSKNRNNKSGNRKKGNTNKGGSNKRYRGKIDITPRGIGYFMSPDFPVDVKISTKNLNGALPLDEVEIIITDKKENSNNKFHGKVVNILSRGQELYTGILHIHNNHTFFIAEEPKCYVDFYIPRYNVKDYQKGDRVIMKFVAWDELKNNPTGKITGKLEGRNEHDIAMKEILISRGFPLEFSEESLAELDELQEEITIEDESERRDMREVPTLTIDPLDAKDFDDALSFQKIGDGLYEIGIHIADVSHYIHPDMELDQEAYQKATSVYLPDRVLPMLPEKVSNQLCSLRPNEDKRTFSVVVLITESGEIKDKWYGKTLIHSDRRFTYEEAQERIESKEGDWAEEINIMDSIAKKLRNNRFRSGAINFSSIESGFIFDDDKLPIGVKVKVSKDAHQLIEEYMLLANRLVAEFIENYKLPKNLNPNSIYRVHDQPVEEKLTPFTAFIEHFGYSIDMSDPRSIAKSFNKMLSDSSGKPEGPLLEQLGIRTMSKAEYSTVNIGHYGLAFESYTHFTSPIRRYPDVLVHRILFMLLKDRYKPVAALQTKANHCSSQERKATECERQSNKYFQVYFMSKLIGQEFDGVISGVANFGFWVETIEHKCEGLVSVKDSFEGVDVKYIPEMYCLQTDDGRTFQMGDKVRIKVISSNLEKRQLDYQLVP